MASTYIANTRITKGAHKEFRELSERYQRERGRAPTTESTKGRDRPRQQLIPDFVMVIMV